jgi:hypothetical protein
MVPGNHKEQSDWISHVRLGNPNVYRKNVLGIMPDGSRTRSHISEQWRYYWTRPSSSAPAAATR